MRNGGLGPVLAAAVLTLAAFPAAAQKSAPSGKVGYVSTDRVMKDARVAQEAMKALDAEFQKREKEIAGGPARDAERRRRDLLDEMNTKKEEALQKIVERANLAIRRIAEAENFDAVFFEAAYASTRIDLTDKVTRALDAGR